MQSNLMPAKPAANLANQTVQLPETERHEVEITNWRFTDDGLGVEIEVQDDDGVRNHVEFSLSPLAFVVARVDAFIETVLQREPFRNEYFTRRQNLHMNLNRLIRRRVALLVIQAGRMKVVVDWERVPNKPLGSAPSPTLTERQVRVQLP